MPPKADPYASKLHTRISLVLLVLTVALFAILLRTSVHGAANSPAAPSAAALVTR